MGNVKEAIKLFQQMKDSSLVPDVITYSTLMDGLSKDGTLQEANKLLDGLRSEGTLQEANEEWDEVLKKV